MFAGDVLMQEADPRHVFRQGEREAGLRLGPVRGPQGRGEAGHQIRAGDYGEELGY